MGNASATAVFDNIMTEVLSRKPLTKERVTKAVIAALEGADWDDQDNSTYWDNEVVLAARAELHPEEFESV